MTPLHTAARMALDALESLQGGCTDHDDGTVEAITVWCPEVITALREALAQPAPEPIGEVLISTDPLGREGVQVVKWADSAPATKVGMKLYAAPPAAPAVPPTDEQFADMVAEASLAVDLAANPLKLLAFARAVLSAAPVVREPQSREQQIAIREAHCNTASDEYFGARPQVDDATKRRIYEAGFKEGWESGIGGGGK